MMLTALALRLLLGRLTTFQAVAKFAVSAIIHQFERSSLCILARGTPLAKYKKKRARELKHDRFRDTTMLLADRMADRVAGRRQQILYGLIVVVIIAIGIYMFVRWRHKHAEEAQAAIGRAIAINSADIMPAPPPGSKDPVFSNPQDRSERAIQEFQKVAAKYGDPYHTEAQYFIATNKLTTDRLNGEKELQTLSQGNSEIGTLSKFALAQAKESDGALDEAARLYSEIVKANSMIVTAESANLRLAIVYNKQGKKKEAADILFNIVDSARKARDKDQKPIPESAASRAAAQELLKIDPTRHAQLPPPPQPMGLSF
jgi:predicted negative regulator of RcsB-dependent stress response